MGLFFFMMDCDPGSETDEFVCQDQQCVRAYPGQYVSKADCEQKCGSGSADVDFLV